MTLAGILGLVGLALASATWLHYLWLIPRERVPARPTAHSASMVVALGLALFGGSSGEATWIGLAIVSAALVSLYFWVLAQAPMPDGRLVVAVGDPLPEFEARDHHGTLRRISQWRGRPLLLKFFRGHW